MNPPQVYSDYYYCIFAIELYEFLIHFGYSCLIRCRICKYFILLFHRLPFHFEGHFFYFAEGFQFYVITLVYFAFVACAFRSHP